MRTRIILWSGVLFGLSACVVGPAQVTDELQSGSRAGTGGGGGGRFTGCGGEGGQSVGPSLDGSPVIIPARAPPPISGGTLAVMGDGTVVAADPDRDRVWILAPGQTLAKQLVLSEGDEPGRVVEGPAGHAFVALRGAGAVAELDLSQPKLVARHRACPAPRGLGWSAPKQVLTVACATGALARLKFGVCDAGPTLTGVVVQHPAADLRDVVVRTNDVLVSTFRSARVFAVADDGSAAPMLADLTGELQRQVAWRMIDSPKGVLLVHQLEAATPLTFSPCSGTSYGDTASAAGLVTPVMSTGVTAIGGPGLEQVPSLVSLPVDLAVSASGQWALVSAGERAVFTSWDPVALPAGAEPISVAFRGEDLVVFKREPAQLLIFDAATHARTTIALPASSVFSSAHELFHRETTNRLACASCHPEGQDDGHVWLFPEGARRTNSLRGGLKASAPFHWQGDRPDIGAVLADVFVRRMGGLMPSPLGSIALLDWLEGLPALPLPDDLDAAAVSRGKTLFASPQVGCATCHSGPLGTNNATVDVGTGGPFQVPRLVGLASRAPYFHDGRFARLVDRFLPQGGGEAHGHTAALTAAEKTDLLEYLRSR